MDHTDTSDVQCPPSNIVFRGDCLYEGKNVFCTKLSQSYPPRLAIAYGTLAKSAMEVHFEAMGSGLPVPHADSLFDDGLPSEEADEYDDRDSEPEQDNNVVHGNNFPVIYFP